MRRDQVEGRFGESGMSDAEISNRNFLFLFFIFIFFYFFYFYFYFFFYFKK